MATALIKALKLRLLADIKGGQRIHSLSDVNPFCGLGGGRCNQSTTTPKTAATPHTKHSAKATECWLGSIITSPVIFDGHLRLCHATGDDSNDYFTQRPLN